MRIFKSKILSKLFVNCKVLYQPTLSIKTSRILTTGIDKSKLNEAIVTKEEFLLFDANFLNIIDNIKKDRRLSSLTEVCKRFEESLKYNVPYGKKNRGLAVVASYKMLQPNQENIELANILGWLVEILQAFFIVLDDLIDKSETRRSRICWYKRDGIGLTAINDGILLENSIYILLKKYLSHHASYIHIMELFHEATLITILGQMLDCNIVNLNNLTISRYEQIAYNKTAFYSFYLPVALALYLSGNTSQEIHHQAKDILLEIGKFFQIQDDYIDCFGDPTNTGKIGTDIENGKCTWLVVTALQLSSNEQKKIIQENYGKDNVENVKKMKDLYYELGIPKYYKSYEEKSFEQINTSLGNLSKDLPRELFENIISTIYKRTF